MTVASTTLPTTYTAPKAAAASTSSTSSSSGALGSITSNFNDFLSLLMTQLQNQDPTAPMDTNQFTSQLVQFTSVEQQINTNTALNTLIQATQTGNLLNTTSLVGQTVQVSGSQMSLQNGQGSIDFTGTAGTPVNIGVYASSGALLDTATVAPTSGTNSWTWNGQDQNGVQQPDGAYKVMVQSAADGSAIPFTTGGTVTGVTRSGTSTNVQLGALSVDLNAVQSVGNANGSDR
jgi:flagellar basal-body rod modification protein FlgD